MKTMKNIAIWVYTLLCLNGIGFGQEEYLYAKTIDGLSSKGGMNGTYYYSPRMRLRGDTLYVPTYQGLYMVDLGKAGEELSLVAFEGLSVIDFVRMDNRYLALTYNAEETGKRVLFLSEDGGRTHRDITPSIFGEGYSEVMYGLSDNPQNPSSLLVSHILGQFIFQSFDFGKTWRRITMTHDAKPFLSYHPLDTTMIFSSRGDLSLSWNKYGGMLEYSENAGDTWEMSQFMDWKIFDVAFHPQNADILLFTEGGWHIGKSVDRGKTWSIQESFTPALFEKIVFDKINPQTMYGLANVEWFGDGEQKYVVSMYRSVDEGKTWDSISCWQADFEKDGGVVDLLYYKKHLLLYTMKGGIYSLNLETLKIDWKIPVVWNESVTVRYQESVFSIVIYPNPVRDVLHFKTEENLTRVVITDMSGRVVKARAMSGNEREISVSNLRAGMYEVCFHTNNGSVRKKIAVVK